MKYCIRLKITFLIIIHQISAHLYWSSTILASFQVNSSEIVKVTFVKALDALETQIRLTFM